MIKLSFLRDNLFFKTRDLRMDRLITASEC